MKRLAVVALLMVFAVVGLARAEVELVYQTAEDGTVAMLKVEKKETELARIPKPPKGLSPEDAFALFIGNMKTVVIEDMVEENMNFGLPFLKVGVSFFPRTVSYDKEGWVEKESKYTKEASDIYGSIFWFYLPLALLFYFGFSEKNNRAVIVIYSALGVMFLLAGALNQITPYLGIAIGMLGGGFIGPLLATILVGDWHNIDVPFKIVMAGAFSGLLAGILSMPGSHGFVMYFYCMTLFMFATFVGTRIYFAKKNGRTLAQQFAWRQNS